MKKLILIFVLSVIVVLMAGCSNKYFDKYYVYNKNMELIGEQAGKEVINQDSYLVSTRPLSQFAYGHFSDVPSADCYLWPPHEPPKYRPSDYESDTLSGITLAGYSKLLRLDNYQVIIEKVDATGTEGLPELVKNSWGQETWSRFKVRTLDPCLEDKEPATIWIRGPAKNSWTIFEIEIEHGPYGIDGIE